MQKLKIAAKTENSQAGQTLIETVVAIFILIIGISTAMSLATMSFNNVVSSSEIIQGTALARQGIEAVKNIRDTNWQATTAVSCPLMGSTQTCHSSWLSSPNTIPTSGTYDVNFNSGAGLGGTPWSINSYSSYALYYNAASGLFTHNSSDSSTIYSRQITFSPLAADNDSGGGTQGIDVVSTVWWYGHACPQQSSPAGLPNSCKVVVELHLTNWKNY